MDDPTPEELAERLSQLRPAPARWVAAAQSIGSTNPEGSTPMSDENERFEAAEPAEVEGHARPRPRNDENGPEVEGHARPRPLHDDGDDDGPEVEGHARPRS